VLDQRMRFIFFLLLTFKSALAGADNMLSGPDFDAFTKGHTLYYSQNGKVYGAESYFDDGRVRWSFLDGNCLFGRWYEADGLICFEYGEDIGIQCWRFFKTDNGLEAEFDGDDDSLQLYEAYRSPSPLECRGPDVGV